MKIHTSKMLLKALSAAAIATMLGLPAAAETAAEQAKLAKRYRLKAEAFDVEAAKLEDQAGKLARSSGAMAYKWPAMVNGHQDAKEKATQARRHAAESRLLAEHHARLVVEAQAAPGN
jgi:hypothetical protein